MVTILLLSQPQIGSYFGAEVCAVDLNNDSNTDLLLVSAPTYTESDREGLVVVYIITGQVGDFWGNLFKTNIFKEYIKTE